MRAKTLKVSLLAATLSLAAGAAQAGWHDTASAFDAQRLSKLEESKAKALGEAQASIRLPCKPPMAR